MRRDFITGGSSHVEHRHEKKASRLKRETVLFHESLGSVETSPLSWQAPARNLPH
jgi:hypothetical protein